MRQPPRRMLPRQRQRIKMIGFPERPFLFLRHGQTIWNVEGRMQGHTDVSLNDVGLAQARQAQQIILQAVLRPTLIVSSDLSRAFVTATIVAEGQGWQIIADAGLRERNFGAFEGRLTREVRAEHNLAEGESITKILPPDAEQWPQTLARVSDKFSGYLRNNPTDTILFVGHGATFRALYEVLGGPRMEAENCCPYLFTPGKPAWSVTTLG